MKKQNRVIKPCMIKLEGDWIKITKQMIEETDEYIMQEYVNVLERQKKRELRYERCLMPNGTRCPVKKDCNKCKKILRIDIKEPCNGLPRSLDKIAEDGGPMPASGAFISQEKYVENKKLHKAISMLSEEKQLIIRLHMEGLSDRSISAQIGVPQTTVTYRRNKSFEQLRKILKEHCSKQS